MIFSHAAGLCELPALARGAAELPRLEAANDNGLDLSRNGLLRAALKHFAEHGLGAAEVAQRKAEQAFFAGDRKQYRHWLDICRALDRRMADAVRFRQEGRN